MNLEVITLDVPELLESEGPMASAAIIHDTTGNVVCKGAENIFGNQEDAI